MKAPVSEIFNYLNTQRVGVLAVEMPDGSPHAATVHFAHSQNPFVFYFETYREYRKAEALFERKESRASFVVGVSEDDMKTLQLDGVVSLLTEEEMETFNKIYLNKFPEKVEKSKEAKFVFFKFIPTWWRFTDWKTSDGKKIWLSTD